MKDDYNHAEKVEKRTESLEAEVDEELQGWIDDILDVKTSKDEDDTEHHTDEVEDG